MEEEDERKEREGQCMEASKKKAKDKTKHFS
jgi:hypothetical protein